MRILVIEDSNRLRASIMKGLSKSGYAVDGSGEGEEGLWFAESNDYDVIILDIMLPGMDGFTILKKLREKSINTFVLILTAKDKIEDKITGFTTGADDYLVKPFAFEELILRIQALIRRKYNVSKHLLNVKDIEIDTQKRIVKKNGEDINLLPREYSLLEYLFVRRGMLVTRTEIESHIYDDLVQPMSNVVDSAMCILRKKIDTPDEESIIKTRRGLGYIVE